MLTMKDIVEIVRPINEKYLAGNDHTRGPWKSQGWVPTWAYIPIKDANHNLVCSLYPDEARGYSRDEVAANAAFIVRAVNSHNALIEALEEAREFIEGYVDVVDGDYGQPAPNKAMKVSHAIQEALHKASK